MKNWKQSLILDFLAILVLALAFTACDNGNDTTHTHNFGADWKNNATQHWHECSCGEKTGIANHTFENNICTVCGHNQEIPVFREATINLDFTGGGYGQYVATVEGTLLTSEWTGLAQKIETAIQNGFNSGSVVRKGRFFTVFGQNMAVMIVEKTSAFDKWSVHNTYLIYLNFDYLVGLSDEALVTNLTEAILEMDTANLPVASKVESQRITE